MAANSVGLYDQLTWMPSFYGRQAYILVVTLSDEPCTAAPRLTPADYRSGVTDAWRDPEAQREFLARIERYQQEGPLPAKERTSWDGWATRAASP